MLFWLKVWIEVATGIVLVISVFSLFSLMNTGCWAALIGGIIWTSWRLKSIEFRSSVEGFKKHRLFYLLVGLCFVSLCVGPHCFLDSYSYRIPQMLLWLQEGHPWSVPNVDIRINQMPHVWSFLSTPFFFLLGERGLAVYNFISYLILFGVLKAFAKKLCTEQSKINWILIIFMASPVMVMQAPSNDNVLTCVTFLMIATYFALLQPPSTATVSYSALAFALCCGIKPQYVTLAPLWLIWFFLGGGNAPAKKFEWKVFGWLFPLLIICSPLPTFSVNYFYHGSIMQPHVVSNSLEETGEKRNITTLPESSDDRWKISNRLIHSYSSLTTTLFALPVNPIAGWMTSRMHEMAEEMPFFRLLDWHRQRIYPILITEGASLSFFATLALLMGLIKQKRIKRHYKWLTFGSFIAMTVAIWLTTPGTLGRSFVGFFMLMLPLAFAGLASVGRRFLVMWGVVSFAAGLLIIVINPACPLWPAKTVAEIVPHQRLKKNMLGYAHYSKRDHSARELVRSIPEDELVIGAVLAGAGGTPSVELWKPYRINRIVKFYSSLVSSETLAKDNVSFLIVKHPELLRDGEFLASDFLHRIKGKVIDMKYYTSFMSRGPESWFLVRTHAK